MKSQFCGVLMLGAALSACSTPSSLCSPLECEFNRGSSATRQTGLEYLIHYGLNDYEVVASFDVHFLDGSSTNGVTAHLTGKYDEEISSEELLLRGKSSSEVGKLGGDLKSKKVYHLSGTIRRPETEDIRQSNLRALSIRVEEVYQSSYWLR